MIDHRAILFVLLVALCGVAASAQQPFGHEETVANPVPPPAPPPKEAEPDPFDDPRGYRSIIPESDAPWGIPDELLAKLQAVSATYSDYAQRFTCDETARQAEYKKNGKIDESTRNYAYLLVKEPVGDGVSEFRQRMDRQGNATRDNVDDDDPFPPAYAWVFLFSDFNQPFFSYRHLGDRFEGFDWVHEIQFRGSMPFTNGQDIRQWEGVILVDAVNGTPLSIRAEPQGQGERLQARYREYTSSFNIIGMRTKPRPYGFRAEIEFRFRANELAFPTSLRYDTFEAVARNRVEPISASTRTYDDYRFFGVRSKPKIGEKVEDSTP